MKNKIIYIFSIVLSLFVGISGTIYVYNKFDKQEKTIETISTVNIEEKNNLKSSIDKVYNSVVVIETYNLSNRKVGTGTGFVYKKDEEYGYIITNHHVVDDSRKIKVTNMEDETVEAELVGSDEYSDIAVLKVPLKSVLMVATIGTTDDIDIGDTVFTVGSPLGIEYKGTVTKGILSGKERQVTVNLSRGSFVMDVLQTDAAINPGNSGGPLLNINGEVIGVTSLKLVEDEIEGMGFALPIEIVMSSVEKLETGEEVTRPLLGVQLIDVDSTTSLRKYDLDIDSEITYGTVIVKVDNDSVADKAGLQEGDVILGINNDKIKDTAHFRYSLYKYNVGDTIKVKYNRNGKENVISIKLDDNL